MSKRKRTKFVHEGNYVAEVDVELLEEPEWWSPYLSLEDAYRLDDVLNFKITTPDDLALAQAVLQASED